MPSVGENTELLLGITCDVMNRQDDASLECSSCGLTILSFVDSAVLFEDCDWTLCVSVSGINH